MMGSSKIIVASIDDVTECILALGQGSLLAQMDIKEAYCNVPVHPDDHPDDHHRCVCGQCAPIWLEVLRYNFFSSSRCIAVDDGETGG